MSKKSPLLKSELIGWALAIVGIATLIYLVLTGKLGMYVHPRYTLFTTAMAIIALPLIISAAARRQRAQQAQPNRSSALQTVGGFIAFLLVVPLVLLPTATLSTDRALSTSNTPISGSSTPAAPPVSDVADENRTVLDWAQELATGADATALAGRSAKLLGFITPDPDVPEDFFRLTRYSVTCCVVDAQAVFVTVYAPDWQKDFTAGDWVQLSGYFASSPSAETAAATVLVLDTITPGLEPANPYLTTDGSGL
ncbi:TIGR03943 family putative permease subunit [Canibacter zhoujuaniae]|uniref:TIGR03943 family putative permease subunit n=1 Tax=Canibacter zhoujuaniae TaxID=2708343 RepID=UPI00141DAAFC|nr:TIGR03943 family protein [Canibacter zhoujuaniae]